MTISSASALRALQMEYKILSQDPLEGFQVKLAYGDIYFDWDIGVYGPPETLYEGGYFKARMKFPLDYPFSPPSFRFITKMWHPNIYENGDVCVSILHSPVSDCLNGELPSEKWNPTQNVRTILLSVLSLLNEPNIISPANTSAAEMYARWKNTQGADKGYENIVRGQVSKSRFEAEQEGIIIPLTLEDYCSKPAIMPQEVGDEVLDETDFFDEDYDLGEESGSSSDGVSASWPLVPGAFSVHCRPPDSVLS